MLPSHLVQMEILKFVIVLRRIIARSGIIPANAVAISVMPHPSLCIVAVFVILLSMLCSLVASGNIPFLLLNPRRLLPQQTNLHDFNLWFICPTRFAHGALLMFSAPSAQYTLALTLMFGINIWNIMRTESLLIFCVMASRLVFVLMFY